MFDAEFVAITLRGRLGNQLFEFAAAKAVASPGVPIAVDAVTPHGAELFDALQPGQVRLMTQWEMARLARPPRVPVGRGSAGPLVQRQVWKVFDAMRNTSVVRSMLAAREFRERDTLDGFDPEFSNVRPPVILDGFFQSDRYFEGHARQIVGALRDVSAEAESAWSALPSAFGRSQTVAVVVRAGFDYAAYGWSLPFSWYRGAATRVAEMTANPSFIVFSDLPFAAQAAAAALADLGPAFTVEGLSAIDQLHLISRCRHAVVSNSTFAWWGAWIGDYESGFEASRVVVAPEPWIRPGNRLVPDRWTTLTVPATGPA